MVMMIMVSISSLLLLLLQIIPSMSSSTSTSYHVVVCLFVRRRLHPLPVVRSCVALVEVVSIVIKEVSLNSLLLTSSLVAISFVDDEQHAICCNK
jgi:hypothetical protein